MTTHPPSQIGRYRIESELGRGTMGVVYEARDTTLGRVVALKTFAAMVAMAPHEREAFEQRFLSEARISATLDDKHVVAVYDVGRDFDTGLLFMALEYVRGETLASALSRGPMPWEDAARIVSKVARALQTAHSHHIVHRDIKPANIMLNIAGEPKIMDFGIAKASAAHLTMAGQVFGTPAYMSPEQASGEEVDGRSDVFSLGAVLYELLTNTRPFEAATMPATLTRILHDEPRPASSLANIPKGLDSVIERALRKDRNDRYDSAAHFANDLEQLLEGQPPRYATQPGPLDTLSIKDAQRPRRTSPPTQVRASSPTPSGQAHVLAGAPEKKTSLRLLAAIAAGVALGVIVLLLFQRAQRPAGGSTAVVSASPVAVETPTPSLEEEATLAVEPSTVPESAPRAPQTEAAPASPASLSMERPGRPAQVTLDLRHPFASGSLRIKVDDRVVFTSNIHGMPKKALGEISGYDGRFGTDLMIPSGNHTIQVEVRSGSSEFLESARVVLRGGESRQLRAVVDKELTLTIE